MNFSNFGNRFTKPTGVSQIMDDLGDALRSPEPVNLLGGGNPARIEAVSEAFLEIYQSLGEGGLHSPAIDAITNYSNPQGDAGFIDTLVDFFNRHYDWQLTRDNIALTNGSQNAFFYLFNLFSGQFSETSGEEETTTQKAILLPLAPEYVGYEHIQVDGNRFVAVMPEIIEVEHNGEDGFFKYKVDFEALENLPELQNGEIGAICCSRPTNPTGNVLTDDEMARLHAIAKRHDIPLIIDNAYGEPFPNIIYPNVRLTWDEQTILCFSLSKIGMPGLRTGIVVASPEVVRAVDAMNALVNLAPTRFGAVLAKPLFADDQIVRLSNDIIKPFYAEKVATAIELLKGALGDTPMRIHKPEGAMFLWLWFKDLPITTGELYNRLKARQTLVVPSEHFYPGVDTDDPVGGYRHAHECIRMSITGDERTQKEGIAIIGEVVKEAYANG